MRVNGPALRRSRRGAQRVSPFCELRRSRIHGQGVFARYALPAGLKLGEYLGERIDKAESNRRGLEQEALAQKTGVAAVYIFDLNETHDLDGNKPYNWVRFVNHSCAPNCEVVNEDDRLFLYTVAPVARGAELTFDYGYDIAHFMDHPCRCGSANCPGYIVSAEQRDKLRQRLRKVRP